VCERTTGTTDGGLAGLGVAVLFALALTDRVDDEDDETVQREFDTGLLIERIGFRRPDVPTEKEDSRVGSIAFGDVAVRRDVEARKALEREEFDRISLSLRDVGRLDFGVRRPIREPADALAGKLSRTRSRRASNSAREPIDRFASRSSAKSSVARRRR
jgi:hypothetical protein